MATLYAAKGASSTTSDLYTLNPASGAAASVGPIGFAVTGLAMDPITGILYGVTSNGSTASPRCLITINPATGAGTLVGSLGMANPVTDIAFDSAGNLYGWPARGTDSFVSINKATGAATPIGAAKTFTSGGGLSFTSGGVLYHIPFTAGRDITTIALGTGVETNVSVLGAGPGANGPNAASFNSLDVCYVLWNINPTVHLVTVDVATGVVTDIGATDNLMDALAWDLVPTPPPPGAPILIAEPPWRFAVADVVFNGSSPPGFSTLTFLDHRATSRQLRYFLRKAPEASGQVPADDPEVNIVQGGEPYVEEGVRILIGLRREGGTPPWKPRFAGPILQATRSVQGDAPFVDFTAYGPRQLLYLRPVRQGNGLLLGQQGLTFKQQKGSDILLALLGRTETVDGPTFIDFTTGTLEDTDPIDINFQQSSSVGEALDQLEATGTIDILLPTVYDPAGHPGILAQLNIYVQAGSIKRSAIMAWDMPGRNLDEINWLEDGAQRANNVELYTSDGLPTPIQTDGASIAKYGSYWGQQTYPVQTQLAAVEAEAAVQLLINKGHPETLTLGPSPRRAPIVFNEWWLADWLPTYASARLGKKINGLYRVYDFTLNLEDDATETVRDLLVSANKQPA